MSRCQSNALGIVWILLVSFSLPALLIGAPLTYFGARDLYSTNIYCGDDVITPDRFAEVTCAPSYVAGVQGDLRSINESDLQRQRETGQTLLPVGLLLLALVVGVALGSALRYVRRKRQPDRSQDAP